MQRPFLVPRQEGDGHQIEGAAGKTRKAEFRRSVFALVMPHRYFRDAKAVPVRDNRQVAVHLTVDAYVLHHLTAIGFQAAVKIMQPDAAEKRGEKIVYFRSKPFSERIAPYLFPPRHQVVSLFYPGD